MAAGDATLTFVSIAGLSDVVARLYSDSAGSMQVGTDVSLPQTALADYTGTYSTVILAADVPAGAAYWQPMSNTLVNAGRSAFAIVPIIFESSGGGGTSGQTASTFSPFGYYSLIKHGI